jgi:hypothetical protein
MLSKFTSPRSQAASQPGSVGFYASVSLVAFLVVFVDGYFTISRLGQLQAGQVTSEAYYVLVVMLGIATAFCLFGIVQSTAAVRGEHMHIGFEVGGPAGLFVLIVLGGFWLAPPTPNSLDVLVELSPPPTDEILSHLQVTVDLPGGRGREHLRFLASGQATILALSPHLRSKPIPFYFESPNYEATDAGPLHIDNDNKIVIQLRKKNVAISSSEPSQSTAAPTNPPSETKPYNLATEWLQKDFKDNWTPGPDKFVNETCRPSDLQGIQTIWTQLGHRASYILSVFCRPDMAPNVQYKFDMTLVSPDTIKSIGKDLLGNPTVKLGGYYYGNYVGKDGLLYIRKVR